MRSFKHPNLIRMESVYETENSIYMILELFRGGNLRSYISKNGPLNEQQAAIVLKAVLKGIKHCHDLNIIHRDIKPDNILFRSSELRENNISVADFGLATFNSVDKYLFLRCGTPGFVAPEIFQMKKETDHYSFKVDIFSLGVTFFFMLFGDLPYEYKDSHQLMKHNALGIFDFKNNKNKFSQLQDNSSINSIFI